VFLNEANTRSGFAKQIVKEESPEKFSCPELRPLESFFTPAISCGALPTSAQDAFMEGQEYTNPGGCIIHIDETFQLKRLNSDGSCSIGKTIPAVEYGACLGIRPAMSSRHVRRVPVGVSFSTWKAYNYGDFACLMLPKLARIADLLDYDQITIRSAEFRYIRQWLDILGLENIHLYAPSTPYEPVHVDELIIVTGPGAKDGFCPLVSDIMKLRRHVLNKVERETGLERIYLSRKGRRSMENEELLTPILEEFGFTVLRDESRDVIDQIRLFANASIIIGPHGAAFSNIMFCKKGATVVELFNENYVSELYRKIAAALNLDYRCYIDGNQVRHDSRAVTKNMTISEDVLRQILTTITGN
jgi:hypothetical protein